MKLVKTILQIALIGQFGFFGVSKIIGAPDMVATFTAFGFPAWFMVLTGLIEVVAVLSLIYGFYKSSGIYVGAFLIAGLTVGATFCHIFLEGSLGNAIPPMIVFVQNGIMLWLQARAYQADAAQLNPSTRTVEAA